MEEKKSYVNYANGINNELHNMPKPIIDNHYNTNFNQDLYILNLYYPDVWYCTAWVVSYVFIDGVLINPFGKCVAGAFRYTEAKDEYPKFDEEKIKEYFKIALEEFEKEKLNVQRSSLDEGGESLNVEP